MRMCDRECVCVCVCVCGSDTAVQGSSEVVCR